MALTPSSGTHPGEVSLGQNGLAVSRFFEEMPHRFSEWLHQFAGGGFLSSTSSTALGFVAGAVVATVAVGRFSVVVVGLLLLCGFALLYPYMLEHFPFPSFSSFISPPPKSAALFHPVTLTHPPTQQLILTKLWTQARCVNKLQMQYLYTVEYYSAKEKNKIRSFARKCYII